MKKWKLALHVLLYPDIFITIKSTVAYNNRNRRPLSINSSHKTVLVPICIAYSQQPYGQ